MKTHHEIIRSLPEWKKQNLKIHRLSGGMTNFNYLVSIEKKRYVVRFAPSISKSLGLDRAREIFNYGVAYKQGIGPRIFKHYPYHSALIVEYLEGRPLTKKQSKRPEAIKSVAGLLKKLHQGNVLKGKRSPAQRGRDYIEQAKQLKAWLPSDISWYLKQVKLVEKRLSPISKTDPCHQDLMFGNIVLSRTGKYRLIDWEYSGSADRRFDLAMFSVKGSFGKKEDSILVHNYAPNNTEKLYNDLQYMKLIVFFAEAAYGLLQNAISQRQDVNYKSYALENLKGFKRLAKKLKL
ncbi:MAG: choline/ethanolamine kinase family protein [Patescibacteria group bacterium]